MSSVTVYPLIFHSIQDEVPEASRGLITRLYQLWLALGVTLVINFIACVSVLGKQLSVLNRKFRFLSYSVAQEMVVVM
jgi:hypothetical protein